MEVSLYYDISAIDLYRNLQKNPAYIRRATFISSIRIV